LIWLIAIAAAAAREQKAEDGTDAGGDGDGLIGIRANRFVSGFGAGDGFVPDLAGNVPGAIQGIGKALARFDHFFPAGISRGGQEGARVFRQLSNVVTKCLCLVIHIFRFLFVLFFKNYFFAAANLPHNNFRGTNDHRGTFDDHFTVGLHYDFAGAFVAHVFVALAFRDDAAGGGNQSKESGESKYFIHIEIFMTGRGYIRGDGHSMGCNPT
jgi:hypothetical protein